MSPTQSKMWFLAGTSFDASTVVRTCTTPAETPLFFPVVNTLAVPLVDGENAANQRQLAIDSVNTVLADPDFSRLVTVDGKKVDSDQIVRALSPVFNITLPEENVYDPLVPPDGVSAGKYEGASVDGLWVKLPPLPQG